MPLLYLRLGRYEAELRKTWVDPQNSQIKRCPHCGVCIEKLQVLPLWLQLLQQYSVGT
jgi:hypothetical protein